MQEAAREHVERYKMAQAPQGLNSKEQQVGACTCTVLENILTCIIITTCCAR